MHLHYFYSLRGIIIIMATQRTTWEHIRKHVKNPKKNIRGMIKITYFYFSILQLFQSSIFFSLLQQFTAGENLKIAGNSASY